MGEIYANSVCTIAAHAFGDDGGSGFLQSSLSKAPAIVSGLTIRSRKWENDDPVGLSEKSQDYSVIATPLGNPNADIDNSVLAGRGWVMQERLLSPVILHFTPQRVYWARSAGHSNLGMLAPIVRDFPASRREGMRLMGEASSSALMRRCAISKVTPYSWYRIIQEYSTCTLSKEKDKLYAIQGIALLMQTFTADEYHSGLWLSWVHMGLLWSSTNRNAPRPSSKRAPSWSWVSVDGPIQYFMDYLEIDSVFKEGPRPGMDVVRLDDWQLEVGAILEKVTVSDYSDPRAKTIYDNKFRAFVGARVPHRYLIDRHQQRIGWVRLDNECHLTALGPLSSCIYTTSSPSTLSRPIYIHLFTVTTRKSRCISVIWKFCSW